MLGCGDRRAARGALIAALFIALPAGLAAPCAAATFAGTLSQAGVAWISDDSKPAPMPETTMRNTHKSFQPDLVVITVGSTVRFPNDDAFFHSIYSEGQPDPFDIGFYDTGPGKAVPFVNPGVVMIRCHIHGSMHATIVVVDGPWTQTHAPDEKFTLTGVRPGSHTLHLWSPDGGEKTSTIRL